MQPFKWQKYEYEYECEYEYEYECECEYDHLHAFGDETRKLWGGKNQGDLHLQVRWHGNINRSLLMLGGWSAHFLDWFWFCSYV